MPEPTNVQRVRALLEGRMPSVPYDLLTGYEALHLVYSRQAFLIDRARLESIYDDLERLEDIERKPIKGENFEQRSC